MLVRKEGLEIALNVLIFVDTEKVRRTEAAQRFQNQKSFFYYSFIFIFATIYVSSVLNSAFKFHLFCKWHFYKFSISHTG